MKTEGFKYYAFISYSHKDQKLAKRLHKRLQSYHLPSALLKSHPGLPKRLSPVFMDESNLVATGTLKEALYKNLDDSNYLIVICSPNSAKSEYVNDEVEYFIRTGRTDKIIPLIIDGVPHAEDESLECFPPSILELPRENELLGIDLKKFGERDSFSRVIATLLKLDLDNFVDDEKRRRRRKIITFASAAAALMIAAGIYIWHNIIPHYNYYHTYVYKWEKPVGLFEVKNESDRMKMEYTYRFTTVGGKVRTIERINSAGILVDPGIITPFTELPMIRFVSDRTVEYYDVNGKKIYRKEYTKNFEAADFYRGDEDLPYAIQSNMPDSYSVNKYDYALGTKEMSGNIIRLTFEYDNNGYVIRKMFRLNNHGGNDNKGVSAQDKQGRGGFICMPDEKGRVTEVRYWNTYRDPMNVGKVFAEHIDYGNSPYPVKITYADINGSPVLNSQGIASIAIVYDEYFNAEKLSYYGIIGESALNTEQEISEAVFTHDYDNGFLTSESFYDTNLAPCLCEEGYHRIDFSVTPGRSLYDTEGREITQSDDLTSSYSAQEQYDLGKKAYDEKDYSKAFELSRKAAERGHAIAQAALGYHYANGYGVERDLKKAAYWYQKAAEQGDAMAQTALGYCYANGYGVERDLKKAAYWYQKAAEQGDAMAQNNLGLMYKNGYEFEQDYGKALEWFRKAAEQGNMAAQHSLGFAYDEGYGVERDYRQAAYWYRKAAEKGYANSQNNLGVMYEHGHGVEKDNNYAFEWYTKAAEQGNIAAQRNLASMYRTGKGGKQDDEQAVYWYRKAANQGDTSSQFFLGYMYYEGRGVEQDYKQASEWYTKAAEQGHAISQFSLGYIYEKGYGVKKDYSRAIYWYQRAAEQGDDDAQNNLGSIYKNGEGVNKNYRQAFKWYQKAAKKGNDTAQYNLGSMYRKGEGIDKDYEMAVYWYRKAAEQGHTAAQRYLGYMYYHGNGVNQSYKRAVFWWTKAAEQGEASAQYNLGITYEEGNGVVKNLQTAYMWYYLAHLSGDESAEDELKPLEEQLTESQINEAKTQAQKKFNEIEENNK